MTIQDILISKTEELQLDRKAIELLSSFSEMVIEENKKFNLTAIVEPYDFAVKHILDSLASSSVLKELAGGKREVNCIDVGSGAGFPGMPLAIVNPSIKFTLTDSNAKKCQFLVETAKKLKIENVTVICGRAEEQSRGRMREGFQLAVSRAVAPLNTLLEYISPFISEGGHIVSYKGKDASQEIDSAKKALEELNCEIEREEKFLLDNKYERSLIIIKKTGRTPLAYPRENKKIKASPL